MGYSAHDEQARREALYRDQEERFEEQRKAHFYTPTSERERDRLRAWLRKRLKTHLAY